MTEIASGSGSTNIASPGQASRAICDPAPAPEWGGGAAHHLVRENCSLSGLRALSALSLRGSLAVQSDSHIRRVESAGPFQRLSRAQDVSGPRRAIRLGFTDSGCSNFTQWRWVATAMFANTTARDRINASCTVCARAAKGSVQRHFEHKILGHEPGARPVGVKEVVLPLAWWCGIVGPRYASRPSVLTKRVSASLRNDRPVSSSHRCLAHRMCAPPLAMS